MLPISEGKGSPQAFSMVKFTYLPYQPSLAHDCTVVWGSDNDLTVQSFNAGLLQVHRNQNIYSKAVFEHKNEYGLT